MTRCTIQTYISVAFQPTKILTTGIIILRTKIKQAFILNQV